MIFLKRIPKKDTGDHTGMPFDEKREKKTGANKRPHVQGHEGALPRSP